MEKRLKALVIAEIPAPYRVDIFLEMAKNIDLDVFFQDNKDQSRSPDYFVKSGALKFSILDDQINQNIFKSTLSKIQDYDLLIAYHPVCKAALQAEWVCRRNHIPYFVNIDGAFINPNLIKDTIKRWVYRNAAGCFSGGSSATAYYLYYGVKKEKIFEYGFTSLHPEDILDGVIKKEEKENKRQELGLLNKKTIIAIGQFIPRKGFDILLKAWRLLSNIDAQLLIVGGGPDRCQYEEYITKNSLRNVKLIDFMSKDKLKEYYLASDIFVLPTREDIWGLVINEAMSFGLPVITTDRCNAGTQLIVDGENGYIVPVDEAALAERMRALLMLPSLEELGQNNISKISDYTIENAAASNIQAIMSVMYK